MRRFKKRYERPKKLFDKARIQEEHKLVSRYGLKNKREIWKAESMARNFRRRARDLISRQAAGEDIEADKKELFDKLLELGLVKANPKLDDVLDISATDVLDRRLQTMVFKRKIANTPRHARQLIAHGHILVGKRKVNVPGYLVNVKEERKIKRE